MNTTALRLAVVGHSNTGKTSLLRTLLRDRDFGQVADRAGTTRHVEGARLSIDGATALELFDTPGLEDPSGLRDYLDLLCPSSERLDGPARIERFLASSEASRRYEQEAKVLRQLSHSDAGLYVIDARDPVLGKHQDELALLSDCAKPLLPVLNFSAASHNRAAAWADALARAGLHAYVPFDTVAPAEGGEAQLYASLALLISHGKAALTRLTEHLAEQRQQRQHAGIRCIAELLLNSAALRHSVPSANAAAALSELQNTLREREQHCVRNLLQLYGFHPDDALPDHLPLNAGRWGDDLFHPETLKQLGIKVGGGMAAGAASGVGIDLLFGGMTLGAAALLGAVAGGGLQTARNYGKRLIGKLKGHAELTVDDNLLRLLAARGLWLLAALDTRGHAATEALQGQTPTAPWPDALPKPLRQARAHPQWCAWQEQATDEERQRAVSELAAVLHDSRQA
ncbi:GTPase/DUF3482 domain-containing protein [Atopomonas sediminilitoris]|uniref:GTPase/DUF3482 domain-containing protein n=1 Tax=Atopomonas sediminilitoris TaxID=2919919 RepID=UPI001F4ED139|nr:GTPase/DUF3482 domain-containing protein [Atopomonas sediminilitoris]MCJ8169609.1 GTPase/DUF3482 domain-containing protein [Atopomonas sediminilitoris]